MQHSALRLALLTVCLTLGIPAVLYGSILGLLLLVPSLQAHAIYLHKVKLTWSKDLNVPEQFGFAHNQVAPFHIPTPDGESLHAWHILPLALYQEHQTTLVSVRPHSGPVKTIEETPKFQLLAGNPDALLVLYFHGTSGTLASGFRPASYRALYATDPQNIHILTFDYRGYGDSTGHPSESGLITDALAVVDWALNTAGVPPERIVIFGQSLGSAVALALAHELAKREPDVQFAGIVTTASFSDVPQLTATYRIGGVIPVLSPIARLTPLFNFVASRLTSKWDNMERIGEFVGAARRFDVTLIHAEDDTDIPMEHSVQLFQQAVRKVEEGKGVAEEDVGDLLGRIEERRESVGEGGSTTVWRTEKGVIRLEILKYGVHDMIMSYPATSLAVGRAFKSVRP